MINKKIRLSYVPRKWAIPFHENNRRWMVLVVHRRAGKTTAAVNFMQVSALKKPGSHFAYIAPTYKMAKNTAWSILKQYAKDVPGVIFSESELMVKYPNNSKIVLYGADSPDSLRGMGLSGVVFDEYSQQPANVFTEIIRPALADHGGYAIWIGTPKGRNDFYRLFEKHRNDSEWLTMLLTTNDTNALSEEEVENAKKTMSEDEFQQEFMCSFDASIKGAYYAKELTLMRQEGRIKVVPYDPMLKVHTVWDLGIGDATAIGFYQKSHDELRKIDYLEFTGISLAESIAAVQRKSYIYGKHFAPFDINVKELTSGKSRLEIAKGLGIKFEIVTNLSVEDGINAARMVMRRLWVNEEKCRQWLDAMVQYQKEWDENAGMFKDQPLHNWTSHAADEFRYAAIAEDLMTNEEQRKIAQIYYPHNYNPNRFDHF